MKQVVVAITSNCILTEDSFGGVVLRKNTVVISIACSGISRRNLSPISAKADNRATWSPCYKETLQIILLKELFLIIHESKGNA